MPTPTGQYPVRARKRRVSTERPAGAVTRLSSKSSGVAAMLILVDENAVRFRRRAVQLEWTTNGWNAMEVFVTVMLGVLAGSLALIAFGLDSLIEVFAVLGGDLAPREHDARSR